MKSNIVIGGTGYIGNTLCNYLADKDIEYTILDPNIYGYKVNTSDDIEKIDLSDTEQIKNIDWKNKNIVLLAGLVGDPITKKYPDLHKKINEKGIQSLITYLSNQEINKLIFVSTCSNYGNQPTDHLLSEESTLDPKSLYAEGKVAAEQLLMSLDVNYTILRFATAFGHSERMRFDLTLNEFVAKLYYNFSLEIYDAKTWRPYCHVKDFARVIAYILESNSKESSKEIFNVGNSDNNITKLNLVEKIQKETGSGSFEVVDGSFDPRDYKVDFSKLENKLKFKTKFSIDYGIQEIIEKLSKNYYGLKNNYEKFNNFGNYKINFP